VRYIALVY